MKPQRTIDRTTAKMIAYKRIVTGSLSLAGAVWLVCAIAVWGHPFTAQIGFGLVIFVGGGAWALRDGLRLRRELKA